MAAAVQPNGEMYNGFKLINPLYSAGRTQPHPTSQSPSLYSSVNTGQPLVSDHHSVPSNQHNGGDLPFQLPAPTTTNNNNQYQYYQDNSTWDPNMSAAAVAAAAVVSQQNPPLLPPLSSSQYALHSIDSSRSLTSAAAQSTTAMASLGMVSPIAAAASVVSQADQPQQQAAPVDTSYLYQTTNISNQDTVSSPSLNDVATNLFTLKQTSTTTD